MLSALGGYEAGAATFGQAILNALKIVLVMCIIAKLHKKRALHKQNPNTNYILTDNY